MRMRDELAVLLISTYCLVICLHVLMQAALSRHYVARMDLAAGWFAQRLVQVAWEGECVCFLASVSDPDLPQPLA